MEKEGLRQQVSAMQSRSRGKKRKPPRVQPKTDHLKPWQFKPGQSGNPSGKKKGTVSLKTFAKKYIQELSDEEKLEFLAGLNKKDVWEMAEGKPDTKSDVNVKATVSLADLYKSSTSRPSDSGDQLLEQSKIDEPKTE